MSDIPNTLPFEVVCAARQVEFEQRWLQLSLLEQQKLASTMCVQLLQYEQVVRYWEQIYKQKEEALRLMAQMATQDLSRQQCSKPCLFEGTHDE